MDDKVGYPITIPYPLRVPHGEGVLSLSHNGRMISFRIHKNDHAILKAEADFLGMTVGAMMRWFVVHGLQELHMRRTGKLRQVRP